MTSWADEIMEKTNKARSKIEQFTAISNMKTGEPWDGIKKLYQSGQQIDRFLATLLNGLATEEKTEFLMSKNIFNDMLKADPNVNRGDLSGKEFNSFMRIHKDKGTFRCESEPTPFSESATVKGRRAGAYKLINEKILKHFSNKAIGCSSSSSPGSSPRTSPEYENEVEPESETSFENNTSKTIFNDESVVANRSFESVSKSAEERPVIHREHKIDSIDSGHGNSFSIDGFFKVVDTFGSTSNEARSYFVDWASRPSRFGFPMSRIQARFRGRIANEPSFEGMAELYEEIYRNSHLQ